MPEDIKRISPVIDKGNAIIKKKSALVKFKEAFIAQDVHQVTESVKVKYIIPAMKAAAVNVVNGFITGLLYKDDAAPRNIYGGIVNNLWSSAWNGVTYAGQNINYSGISKQPTSNISFMPNNIRSYEDLEVQPNPARNETMEDAERQARQVLDSLADQFARYKRVRIGDLFDACGVVAQPTYFNYGWLTLDGAGIQFTGTGFKFVMPNPVPLI